VIGSNRRPGGPDRSFVTYVATVVHVVVGDKGRMTIPRVFKADSRRTA
jgi:hypothetical protein